MIDSTGVCFFYPDRVLLHRPIKITQLVKKYPLVYGAPKLLSHLQKTIIRAYPDPAAASPPPFSRNLEPNMEWRVCPTVGSVYYPPMQMADDLM
jgi:hypothetical protein